MSRFDIYATHKDGRKLQRRVLLNNEPSQAKVQAWWKWFNEREPGYRVEVEWSVGFPGSYYRPNDTDAALLGPFYRAATHPRRRTGPMGDSVKLTERQLEALKALSAHDRLESAYALRLSRVSLNSLERRGFARLVRMPGSMFSPRTQIKFAITPAGRAALTKDRTDAI